MGIIKKPRTVDVLLAEFKNATEAVSAIELTKRFESRFNKTTVYRVLDKLENDGVLHSFLGKNGNKWYAKCEVCTNSKQLNVHPHFQCLTCGKVDCVIVDIHIPNIPNREIEASQILIQGTCELCLA